ncbi:hypothetical protein BDZ89DRAFT_1058968 [Hymenopellis radicata]|nr:hypothetical protein BDZ89DRAFT_1058968 [Hymenopellis radicata]
MQPPKAPRFAPTPLAFVCSSAWDPASAPIASHIQHFLSLGYTCLTVDIALPDASMHPTELMQYFDSEFNSALKEARVAMSPVILARASASLIAQTYISSHPGQSLILISPPSCNAGAPLEGHLPEFDFEPLFPIALVATASEMQVLKQRHRLADDDNVDLLQVQSVENEEAAIKISEWFDELGI